MTAAAQAVRVCRQVLHLHLHLHLLLHLRLLLRLRPVLHLRPVPGTMATSAAPRSARVQR